MASSESGKDLITHRLSGPEAVRQASLAARAFGEEQWLTEDELARLSVVVEELLANLYDHGGVTQDEAVELTLASEPGAIRITILDPGMPFDPRAAPRKEQPERGGGAGIEIVRAWAEFVDYQATPQGNRLELILPVGQ